jgi:peptidoglycan L-alanyl-D-glutamate endopeptidase CwlK
VNPASEKRLKKLHPALVTAIRKVEQHLASRGITIEVVQGLRSFEEQNVLFAKGRTAPGEIVTQARGGESNHNYGLAADLCPFEDGKPNWKAPIETWVTIGRAAEANGLKWGGSWKKFVDKPHVQLPSMPIRHCRKCFDDGGLVHVWAEATRRGGFNV